MSFFFNKKDPYLFQSYRNAKLPSDVKQFKDIIHTSNERVQCVKRKNIENSKGTNDKRSVMHIREIIYLF